MSQIQVDMFEVQLGAALLLQFRTKSGKVVRVLADAGVTAGGYSKDHVHQKLADAFEAFGKKERHLDLIIGTHYDADHLEGLVPIIQDGSISIGEAWMPPVANDTEPHAADERVSERHFLGRQLAGEDGARTLQAYLGNKAEVCEQLLGLEGMGEERTSRIVNRPRFHRLESSDGANLEFFKQHVEDANAILGEQSHTHADEDIINDPLLFWDLRFGLRTMSSRGFGDAHELFRATWHNNKPLELAQTRSIAYIRRSAATDAINAASLSKVVNALKRKSIPTSYQMVQDGTPRRFVWKDDREGFVPGVQLQADGLEFLLLGPSESLVKKHWDRLPIGAYLSLLSYVPVPVKSITPSNQLSYVARFKASEQGLLVCGDSGFVDFKEKGKPYHKGLIDALLPLHIIQVAHHAGNNAHFYNVLLEAAYPAQPDSSLLLLSYAVNDKYRPSREFQLFVEQVRKAGVQLLFTSRPNAEKVRDYREAIHKVVGKPGDTGDVRIQFDGSDWKVLKHAVKA